MTEVRLTCSTFYVDVRLLEIDGRWVASDTPDGSSLGLGERAIEAIENALEPFEGIVDELLATVPDALSGRSQAPPGRLTARHLRENDRRTSGREHLGSLRPGPITVVPRRTGFGADPCTTVKARHRMVRKRCAALGRRGERGDMLRLGRRFSRGLLIHTGPSDSVGGVMKRLAVLISLVAASSLAFATPALALVPSNDAYVGRTGIGALPFTDTVDTTDATTDPDDTEMNLNCGFPATDASVWYEVTAPSDETIVIDASGSTYPVGILVATGSPGTFAGVGCGVSGGSAPHPDAIGGPAVFHAVAGESYAILAVDPQFDGGGNGGTLSISVDVAPPPPVVSSTVDGTGHFNKVTGSATVTGTVLCTGVADVAFIDVQLSQNVGRVSTVTGFGETEFTCDGTTQTWSVEVFPFNGLFKGGRAVAMTFAVACGPFECGENDVTRSIRLRA
jgi:hypothetical protein